MATIAAGPTGDVNVLTLARGKSAVLRRLPAKATELTVNLAFSPEDVGEAQRLRAAVFREQTGARLAGLEPDSDSFDAYCQHVIVRDQLSRDVVASTRVLVDRDARLAGGFCAETAFDFQDFLRDRGRVMEIDRICVLSGCRQRPAISLLFSGIARFLDVHAFDWVMVRTNLSPAFGACESLLLRHGLPGHARVAPWQPLPAAAARTNAQGPLPALVQECLALGARVAGPPSWNETFACVDLLLVLPAARLDKRYGSEVAIA